METGIFALQFHPIVQVTISPRIAFLRHGPILADLDAHNSLDSLLRTSQFGLLFGLALALKGLVIDTANH